VTRSPPPRTDSSRPRRSRRAAATTRLSGVGDVLGSLFGSRGGVGGIARTDVRVTDLALVWVGAG
jgi:hypothetical protein